MTLIWINILIILFLSQNGFCRDTEEEEEDDGRDELTLSDVLSNRSDEFRDTFDNMIDISLEIPAKLKKSIIKSIKSYTIVEPNHKEIEDADRALNSSFTLITGYLPDSEEAMNKFCDEFLKKERRETVRLYVSRKFAENMFCRLTFKGIQSRIEKQNNIYCNSKVQQNEFIKNANELRKYQAKLDEARLEYNKRLILMQQTNFGISKLGTFCCAFHNFKDQTLDAITNYETKYFISKMFSRYFELMTQYFCLYGHIIGCDSMEDITQYNVQNNNYSIGLNMIRAYAKITSIIL